MSMPVALWLLPGEPSMRVFAQCVDELAHRHGAPRFLPHVTLHVDRVVPQTDLDRVLDEAAARFAPFAMRAGPTGHSPVRFKALFVTLSGGDITSLAAALAEGVARYRPQPAEGEERAAAYRLEPHLSLLYKELPDAERPRLAAENCFEGESIYFDRITAVTPAPGAQDFSRVEDWVVTRPRLLVGGDPFS
ncbi:MAG: 2'-5' RNA ligase family protein [Burkholderiales bacterium]|nr:2'-5' RNA ligase family protein [Burkholderiales bacterium]